MQWVISMLVLIATFIQMMCAIVDPRRARTDGAKGMGAEDALVYEHPWWRQWRVRSELRSWRDPATSRDIL